MSQFSDLTASVIVRSLNKVDTLGKTIDSIRRQSISAEIVVVDSGSTDGALELAQSHADRVICIDRRDFSYGGSLNLGSRSCSSDVHFALSAHVCAPHEKWIEIALSHYEDKNVGAVTGAFDLPDGSPLISTHAQTIDDVKGNPFWGFSNFASSWRSSVLKNQPFNESLPACEDKEWSWRVLADGWQIIYDRELATSGTHIWELGYKSLWHRMEREARVMTELTGRSPSYFSKNLQSNSKRNSDESFKNTVGAERQVNGALIHRMITSAASRMGARNANPSIRPLVPFS